LFFPFKAVIPPGTIHEEKLAVPVREIIFLTFKTIDYEADLLN
jgi:hypothetical protein